MFTIPLGMMSQPENLTITITGSGTYSYNGSSYDLSITTNDDTINYLLNGNSVTGTQSVSFTNAGTHSITIAKDSANSPSSQLTVNGSNEIVITQATLTLSITGDVIQTYTGSQLSRTVTPSVTTNDNANTIEYLKDGVVTTGVSYITQTNVGTNTDTFSSNNSNYVTNISSSYITIESGETLEWSNGEIINGYYSNTKIFDEITSSDTIVNGSNTINNLGEIISTVIGSNSKSDNDTDTLVNFTSGRPYGWGFYLDFNTNAGIDLLEANKFYFQNSQNSNKTPQKISLWGQEPNSSNWNLLKDISITSGKTAKHGGSFINTTKFSRFRVFLSASSGTGYETQMTDFWIHGHGYST